MDARLARRNVDPAHHQYQHPIDAVLMHSLRRRLAGLAELGGDAELMRLDVPGRRRGQLVEQRVAGAQNGLKRRAVGDLGLDRVEPAGDAAIERVEIPALIMRLRRLTRDRGVHRKRPMPPLPVTPAIGHVGVYAQIVPAARKRVPFGEAGVVQHGRHVRCRRKHIAVAMQRALPGVDTHALSSETVAMLRAL